MKIVPPPHCRRFFDPVTNGPGGRASYRGMTIIELMVVMAIMSVMLALLVPAAGNFGKANSLTAEGNRIHSLIELARQNSLSRNALTALVLNTDVSSAGYLRAFSLWELRPGEDGSVKGWQQISRWETVQEGVVVYGPDSESWKNPGTVIPAPAGMTYQGHAVGSYLYRVFEPSGGLWGNEPGSVKLVEGKTEPGSESVTLTRRNGGESPNVYEIAIIPTTGRTKIIRN